MSIVQQISVPTSNDLLESFIAENTLAALKYQTVAQSAEEVQDIENASAVSMRQNSIKSGS